MCTINKFFVAPRRVLPCPALPMWDCHCDCLGLSRTVTVTHKQRQHTLRNSAVGDVIVGVVTGGILGRTAHICGTKKCAQLIDFVWTPALPCLSGTVTVTVWDCLGLLL